MDFLRYRFFLGGGGWGRGEIRKKICKTVLVNSGLFSGKNECACETVVLEDSFANLFSDFPQKRTVGKSKDRFLGVKNCFWIPRFIGNPKSVFKNLNPDFSMESTSLKFWFFRILVAWRTMGCGSSVQPRSAGQIRNGAEPQNNDVPSVSLNVWYDFLMSGNTPFSCTPSGKPMAVTR